LDEPEIRRAIRAGTLVRHRRGVLVGRDHLEGAGDPRLVHAARVDIALQGLSGRAPAAACLGSAALMHGLSRLGRPPERVRLYRERGGPWRDEDVAILTCGLPAHHVGEVCGVPATTPARTAVDLGRWVSRRSAVVVMDSALRLGVPREEIESVVRDCAGWPGIRNARGAAEFADERAATPLESISRVMIAEHDLPAPELQVPLGDPGFPVGIVDFFWEKFRLVGEADGLFKYDGGPEALRAEKLRQEALEALGYVVVRWTWDDVWRRPEWVITRLRRRMTV